MVVASAASLSLISPIGKDHGLDGRAQEINILSRPGTEQSGVPGNDQWHARLVVVASIASDNRQAVVNGRRRDMRSG
jgi:hypothetical protein